MKENLRQLFQQKFHLDSYRTAVLQNLLHAQQLLREPQFLETTADGDRIYGLGYLHTADGKEVGLYHTEVVHSDVRRKRVGFRQMMRQYVQYGADAALVVFADKEHWRLSYMCDLKGGETAAKRFSYVFGDAHGQYHTPTNRLAALSTRSLQLSHIREAFSVETLSDEFFHKYHHHYDLIVQELERQGHTGASIHDYVKKMMGRIVFLHFLQKKGWLGGNPQFLNDLFTHSSHKGDFLEQVLEPLFFGIFNTEPVQRKSLFAHEGWDAALLRQWQELPYLNGGLFERDEVDKLRIQLPATTFEELFSFMATYNFTVDENDPDDAEVGVDPEMLGKIFESLLEDNKAKGAFYTPKEIVRYMCRESLIAYLDSKVAKTSRRDELSVTPHKPQAQCGSDEIKNNGVSGTRDLKPALRHFVERHELPAELNPHRNAIDRALREVRICDPAIGSGAFPMGLLNELWRCREALGAVESRAALKREIIENNIYGVDIERGAIDIARLRFWLSIVVDADEPEPLPNFDYKFMQGNSLIESFDGFDLSRIAGRPVGRPSTSAQLTLGLDSHTNQRNLHRLIKTYFRVTDHREKAHLRQQINDEVKLLIINSLGTDSRTKGLLDKLDISANQHFFLWHTWFKDIFDNGGFDIVIGNPPYGAKVTGLEKKCYKQKYFSAISHPQLGLKGSIDTFVIFIELGHNLLSKEGCLAYIVPMSVGSSDALTSLQSIIEKSCNEIRISSYSNRPKQIFDAACVRTSIFMFNKSEKPLKHIYTTKLNRRTEKQTIKTIIDNLQYIDSKELKIFGRYAKIGTLIEKDVLFKLFESKKTIKDYMDNTGGNVYYRAAGGRYFNVVTNYPTHSSAEKSFRCQYTDIIGLIMSSSYFYFYQQVYTDGLNLKSSEIDNFPLPKLENIKQRILQELSSLYAKYLIDIECHAVVRQSSISSTHNVSSFKEYKIVHSKAIIDEIDDYIGPLYGLTPEEIDFIKNYELEFRMPGE